MIKNFKRCYPLEEDVTVEGRLEDAVVPVFKVEQVLDVDDGSQRRRCSSALGAWILNLND